MGAEYKKVAIPSTLDLFDEEIVVNAVEFSHDEPYYPIGFTKENIDDPINFFVKGTEHYLDLEHSYFHIEGTVIGSNGKNTDQSEKTFQQDNTVTCINNFFHSLFSAVNVTVNNAAVSFANDNYPYLAYIQNLLNYNHEFNECNGQVYGWRKDTGTNIDSPDNEGGVKRKQWVRNGNKLSGIMRLRSPFFMHRKYCLSFLDLKIVMQRTKNHKFLFLMSGTPESSCNYRFRIDHIALHVRKVKLSSLFVEAVEKRMFKDEIPVTYHMTDSRIMTKTYPAYGTEIVEDQLFHGEIPNRIIIGIVKNSAYNGAWKENPFKFSCSTLTKIGLFVNGAPFPVNPIDVSFPDSIERAYHLLLTSLVAGDGEIGNLNLTLDDFRDGFTLFAFDMSPDQYGTQAANSLINQPANVRLALQFSASATNTITVIIYYEVKSRLQVDSLRQVQVYSR